MRLASVTAVILSGLALAALSASSMTGSGSLRQPAGMVRSATTPAGVRLTTGRRRAVQHPPFNQTPTALDDAYSLTQDTTLAISAPGVLANDILNGATITSYGATGGTQQTTLGAATPTDQGGSVSLNADGGFSFTPAPGFSGTDTFRYVVGVVERASAKVTLTVTPAAPTAVADSYSTPSGQALTVAAPGVLGNDTLNGAAIASYGASSGNEQTVIGTSTATLRGGRVTLNANGGFTFTPAAGMSGNDSFKYVVVNAGGSATATVTIAVQAPAGPDFVVTTPGFFYSFSGVQGSNPVLTLTRGRTYTFQLNVSSIHPFEILDAPAGSVTNNNSTSGLLTFRVPLAAQSYRYHCSIHNFGNTIDTVP